MWSAALPCRRAGLVLLGSILAAATISIGTPAAPAAAPAAASGQVWALALPDSVKTVEQRQLNWLAARGVNTIVAFRRTAGVATASRRRREAVAPDRDRSTEGSARESVLVGP